MTGIILAGGESRRMGTDKAFLMLDGVPLIDRVLTVFLPLFDQTIIVTNNTARYGGFHVRVVKDEVKIKGPLAGIYSGLLHARSDHAFVAACDMPFLNPRLIAYLRDITGDFDAVVPMVNGYPEPLHAVYHRRILPVIQERLLSGDGKISHLYERVRVRYLSESEVAYFDPQMRSFINLNTPTDFKEALCSDSECRSC